MDKLLEKVKCFLLDMDGTIYLDNVVFEGVLETVEKMKKQGRVIFLTNNSSTSQNKYVEKLNKMGFDVDENNIYTSSMATISYLKREYKDKKIFLFGNKVTVKEFVKGGINVTDNNPDLIVIAFNTEFNYNELTKLTDMIRQGVPFICTHDDINCPTENGYKPDVGSFLSLIEKSTGRKPLAVCGKPYVIMGDAIKDMVKLKPDEIAMVGDRLYTDIQFGINNNFVTVCVLSGESSLKDIEKFPDKDKITYIKNGIWELMD